MNWKNHEEVREYHRKYNKKWYQIAKGKNYYNKPEVKVACKKSRKKYDSSSKGKERDKRYCLANQEKRKAKDFANHHIKIPKGTLCCICNKNLATIKHHPDYSKWDEVVFCCKNPCHPILDRERREREKEGA